MRQEFVARETCVGELRQLSVTVPQAARILKTDVGQVRKAIDRRVVLATLVWQGNRRVRKLDGVDVLCLRMRDILNRNVRRELYSHLKHAPDREIVGDAFRLADARDRPVGPHPISRLVHDGAAETVAEMKSLSDFSRYVDDGGRVREADVEAHRIAALLAGGMGADEVLEDYPGLETAGLEAAVRYAQAHPKQGRPYPARTVKSVLRTGAGGGLAAAFETARADER